MERTKWKEGRKDSQERKIERKKERANIFDSKFMR